MDGRSAEFVDMQSHLHNVRALASKVEGRQGAVLLDAVEMLAASILAFIEKKHDDLTDMLDILEDLERSLT